MKSCWAILIVVLLAGCGFEPLYVQRDKTGDWYFGGKTDTSITTEMAQIKVDPVANRFGQMIRTFSSSLLAWSSFMIRPASIVLPTPTLSAIRILGSSA